jgi:hypothetical protein
VASFGSGIVFKSKITNKNNLCYLTLCLFRMTSQVAIYGILIFYCPRTKYLQEFGCVL